MPENTRSWLFAQNLATLPVPMTNRLKVAWITFFPVEWLPEAPDEIRSLPKGHPASWQRVLLRELQKDPSIELHIFAIRKSFPNNTTFSSGNATFYCLKAPGSLRAPTLFWIDTWILRPYMRRIQPDVVHAWGTEQGAGMVASRLGFPFVVTMQGILSWLGERVRLNRYEKLMSFLEGWVLPKAPRITVEAKFAVEYIRSKWGNRNTEQIEHAPDPVFSETERRNNGKPLRFLAMGGINELKGADLLLRCLANLSKSLAFELVCIGTSQTRLLKELQCQLPKEFFARVEFKSGLSAGEVAKEMSDATMLLYPTRGDTSPNSVKEAVVHGIPVVASRVGGIPDYVHESKNGVLFAPDHLDQFDHAVRRALNHPLFSKGIVAQDALIDSRRQLSTALMAKSFSQTYHELAL